MYWAPTLAVTYPRIDSEPLTLNPKKVRQLQTLLEAGLAPKSLADAKIVDIHL